MKKIVSFLPAFFIFFSEAQTNYALSLNGTNQYVQVGNLIPSGSSYTKEAWVYVTTSSGNRNIISSGNSPFWLTNTTFTAGQAGNYTRVTDPTAFVANRWVHTAVTYDAPTTTMKLYCNGILVSTNTSVPAYTAENLFIGSHAGASSFLQGYVDEVRIWTVARSQAEIKAYMFRSPDDNETGLVSYYRCNENSGTALINNTGGANGTIMNSPAWVASPVKYSNNALNFDGTDDHLVLPHMVSSDFTIEFMMNTSSTGGAGTHWFHGNGIVDAEIGGQTNDWGISLVGANIGFGIGQSGMDRTIKSTTSVNTGNWFHVAASWKQSTGEMKLYINGVLEATGTGSVNLRNAPTRITIGQLQTNIQRYNGSLDELRIWNEVRDIAQIQANMNKELNPESENLLAYYTFNQGNTAGSNSGLVTLPDLKNNNNGLLTNFTLSGSGSNFVAQSAGLNILPVVWNEFTAQRRIHEVLLQWSTLSERSTRFFIVQHSSDMRTWNVLGSREAAGHSDRLLHYSYVDQAPRSGKNFYRIQQTDPDGKTSYSEIRLVLLSESAPKMVQSNPVTNGSLIIYSDYSTDLQLFDPKGRMVWKKNNAQGMIRADVSRLPAGIYYLRSLRGTEKILIR